MKIKNAVIVLGAGASKGARVAGGRTPPLDADFLDAAADYFAGKKARGANKERVKTWREFKVKLRAAGLDFPIVRRWRLEQLSTFLEARSHLTGLQLGQGRPRDHARALDLLKAVVCHVLQIEGGTKQCELHKRIFTETDPTAVLSFNYDLIADQSLLALGKLNWRSADYKCATHALVPTDSGRSYYKLIKRRSDMTSIPLLKLHGSMHYEKLLRGTGFRLSGVTLPDREMPTFDYRKVPKAPYLIPPVASKIEIKQRELRDRWYTALDYLHDAPVWIFWGYSFPQTDTISQVLFRTALARNRKKKPVIVVNPDASVRRRVEEVCVKVRTEYYPSMERLLFELGALSLSR